MDNLVEFPKRKKRNGRKMDDLFLERLPDHDQHCDVGGTSFTCVTCGTVAIFQFKGVIFRDCAFYCGGCGVGYKLDNPLFSRNRKRRES